MTVIFIVNAVIISILTPGRSRHNPSDDGTAVHSNTERHDSTADVSTAKVRWHLITHTNGTFSQSLTNCQLQAVCGNTFICQQNKGRDQECICKQLKTGILQYFLHSSLHTINWQFINYSAQCFMSAWKMWARVTQLTLSAYLTSFWECRAQCWAARINFVAVQLKCSVYCSANCGAFGCSILGNKTQKREETTDMEAQ